MANRLQEDDSRQCFKRDPISPFEPEPYTNGHSCWNDCSVSSGHRLHPIHHETHGQDQFMCQFVHSSSLYPLSVRSSHELMRYPGDG